MNRFDRILKACISRAFGLIAFLPLFSIPALAGNPMPQSSNNSSTELAFSIGRAQISMNELVYQKASDRYLSHLRWNAKAPVLTISAVHHLNADWTLQGSMTLNIKGNADLTDWDWIDYDGPGPFVPGTSHDDWTHRSQHPDGDLHRYVDIDASLGRNIAVNDATRINLHGGFKYTLTEMEVYGGDASYSYEGFRNTHFSLPDDEAVINYKQWHRTVFAGAEVSHEKEYWQLSGMIRAGLSLDPRSVDNHWRRKLRFAENFHTAPFAQLRLGAERKLTDRTSLMIAANYQKYFEKRGDVNLSTTEVKSMTKHFDDRAGADMSVTTFEIGVSRKF